MKSDKTGVMGGPKRERVGGVMVSIDAFQALDPGSIPGQRIFFSFFYSAFCNLGAKTKD